MKPFPVILLLIAISISGCKQHDPKPKEDINRITFSAMLGGWTFIDSTGVIFIKTSLHNITADTLTYLKMTCSWADSYLTDNDSFAIEKALCFQNGPMTMKLAPSKSADEFIRVSTKINLQNWRNEKFRIGYNFNLLDTVKDISYNVSKLTDMQNIIWSDTLALAQFWEK